MSQFTPPRSFDFTKPNTWPDWKQRFQRFRLAAKLNKENNEVQINILIYAMGSETDNIFKTFVFAKGKDQNNYDTVFAKFEGYFVPTVNIIHKRAKFHSRTHQGENVELLNRALYELAEACEFKKESDLIPDKLVIVYWIRNVPRNYS